MRSYILYLFLFIGLITQTANAQDNSGREFWFSFPPNQGIAVGTYTLYIVSNYCIQDGLVEMPFRDVEIPFTVEPGTFTQVEIPVTDGAGAQTSHLQPNRKDGCGVKITGEFPFSVFAVSYAENSTAGEMVLPKPYLGKRYITSMRSVGIDGNGIKTLLVATEDNTTVDIQSWAANMQTYTKQVVLNAGETFMWSMSARNCNDDNPVDPVNCSTVNGSVIDADKPIVVMGNSDCSNMGECGACDMMMNQLLPESGWDDEYIVGQPIDRLNSILGVTCGVGAIPPGPANTSTGDYLEISGKVGTQVTITDVNGTRTATIQDPNYGTYGYGYIFTQVEDDGVTFGAANAVITADDNIQIVQYSKGWQTDNQNFADPEAITILPVSYWAESYLFGTIRTGALLTTEGLILTETAETGSILFNGAQPGGWEEITNTPYSFTRVTTSAVNTNSVESTSGAKVGVYGTARAAADSYGLVGGQAPLIEVTGCPECPEPLFDFVVGCPNEETQFSDQSTDATFNIVNYEWDFGDGNTSTVQNPSHTYTQGGDYLVTLRITNDSDPSCTIEYQERVTIPLIPEVDAGKDTTICPGEQIVLGGNPAATLENGVPVISWTSTNGFGSNQENPTDNPTESGTYTLSAENGEFGCIAEDDVEITVIENYSVDESISHVTCSGDNDGSISLDIDQTIPDVVYTWSNGATTKDLSDLGPGDYTITITGTDVCDGIFTYTINSPDPLTITATETSPASCTGADGQALASVNGGTAPYFFEWENNVSGDGRSTNTTLSSGTFGVTVTDDNGCVAETTVTITSTANLDAELIPEPVSCFGESTGEIEVVNIVGAQPLTISITPNAGTINGNSITGLPANEYEVSIQDANGCIINRFAEVEQPEEGMQFESEFAQNVICNGETSGAISLEVEGGTGRYTYDWSPNGPNSGENTNLDAGTYSYTVTDENDCTITGSQTLTEPAPLVVTGSSKDLDCFGDNSGEINTNVSGGTSNGSYNYSWSQAQAVGPNPTGLSAGIYNLVVTDLNGCRETASFTLQQPNEIAVTFDITDENCQGQDGAVDVAVSGGAGNFVFNWSSGESTEDISNVSAGDYTFMVTDGSGCSLSIPVTIPRDNGNVSVSRIDEVKPECKLTNGAIEVLGANGSGPYSYAWSNGSTSSRNDNIGPGSYTVSVLDANSCEATADFVLTSTGSIIAQTTVTAVSCFNGSDGQASASSPDGQAPFTYAWNDVNNQMDSIAVGLSSGSYTVTITDARGCEASTFAFIPNQEQINATLSKTDPLCADSANGIAWVQSVTGGVGNYSYSWSNGVPGQSNDTITQLVAGTVNVVITDGNNCSESFNIELFEPNPLTVVFGQDSVSCKGGADGVIWATVSGGTGPFQYDWGSPQVPLTADTVPFLSAGIYGVIITDANGCINQGNFGEVFEPALGIEVDFASQRDATCNGFADGAARLDVRNFQGAEQDLIYQWSSGETTALVTGKAAGNYSVTVTDANGCFDDTTLIIDEPLPFVIDDVQVVDERCFNMGGEITIQASGDPSFNILYEWEADGSFGNTLSDLSAGDYTVRVFDVNSQCDTNVTVTVNRFGQITADIDELNPVFCPGGNSGSLEVTASNNAVNPLLYNWNSGQNTDRVNSLSAGNYMVTVEDADGCVATTSYILIDPLPMVIDFNSMNPVCFEYSDGFTEAFVTNGQAPYSYQWNTGSTNKLITDLPQGTYAVTVTDDYGCTMTNQIDLVHPPEIILDLPDVVTGAKSVFPIIISSVQPVGDYTYYWYPEELVRINGQARTNAVVEDTSMIYLRVEDANGCFDIDSVLVNFLPFVDVKIPNSIVYGDPDNGIFRMQDDKFLVDFNMKIYDRWGNQVFESNNVNDGWDGTRDGERVGVGVFMYVITFTDIKGEQKRFGGNVTVLD